MTNSIYISKLLYQMLCSDTEISNHVGNRIFPIIAENNANYPFITYCRDSIYSNGCKDGYFEDKVTFSVMVASDTYLSSLDIANRVRQILEKRKIVIDNITLYNVRLISIDESYNDNAYIQNLSFECTVE